MRYRDALDFSDRFSYEAGVYSLLRACLFLLPPERAHAFAMFGWRVLMAVPWLSTLIRHRIRRHTRGPDLRVQVLGQVFENPVGLAAGFDKNGSYLNTLAACGFGFLEMGTLTAHPQPGNPKPRLFRLKKDQAIINRMGFNNLGSEYAARRLQNAAIPIKLGINIGKSKITPLQEAAEDYALSLQRLAPYADYIVVNVSSPNTPGLRDLQAVEALEPLLQQLQRVLADIAIEVPPPMLVKIAPDLHDDDLIAIAHMVDRLALDGMIATNTTISREGLEASSNTLTAIGAGGLSGRPLERRSLTVLKLLKMHLSAERTLISVGGIENAAQVWERLEAGAHAVQLYSSFVYGGPMLIAKICQDLKKRLAKQGKTSLVEVFPHLNGSRPIKLSKESG